MSTLGHHLTAQGADLLCHELDRIIHRLTRNDAHLALYRNEAGYTILDLANGYERMLPPTSLEMCVRVATAFKKRHPEARVDPVLLGSGEVGPLSGPVEDVAA